MNPKIVTFGCRLNTYESEIMRDHAQSAGLSNAIIFNTCTVTAAAERQAYQAIRKARRENPDAFIIVTGCAVQVNPQAFSNMPEVNRVLGNEEKLHQKSFLPDLNDRVIVNDIMAVQETASHLVTGFDGRCRAFLQVQNGCDHRCTFCTIPFGRGNSRSVPLGTLVMQARELVHQGFQEIVLTGVDITAYGKDLPVPLSLGKMIKRLLAQLPELPRLRLSSLDSIEVDEDLFEVIANETRLMPHLHISLQSGDNMILKRMKRRHLRQDAIDFCEKVRKIRPEIVFGADLIAGFPTETDLMFQKTVDIIQECGLSYLHIFPYSARPGTPAARMPQVEKSVIKERAALLRHLGGQALERLAQSFVGKSVQVLMEKENFGRSEHFSSVTFKKPAPVGKIIQAHVIKATSKGILEAQHD